MTEMGLSFCGVLIVNILFYGNKHEVYTYLKLRSILAT